MKTALIEILKHTYQLCGDLESFENDNDETDSNALDEEYADPSNNDESEDSGSELVETSAARQDHVQDDSGKELNTGDASKKRKTTGLNQSES